MRRGTNSHLHVLDRICRGDLSSVQPVFGFGPHPVFLFLEEQAARISAEFRDKSVIDRIILKKRLVCFSAFSFSFFNRVFRENASDSSSLSGLVERKLIIHAGSQRSINAGSDTAKRGEEEERSPL